MKFSRNRRFWQTAAISVGFVALYFGIRAMPVKQCNFLHYRDYLGKDGVIEECGIGEADFFDLDEFRYPVVVDLAPESKIAAGQPTRFALRLANSQGNPIAAEDLAISHTERLHLLIVDDSLADYQHLHPKPTGIPGEFSFAMTPVHGGHYRVYLDFIPIKSGRRTLAMTSFQAAGSVSGDYRPVVSASPVAKATVDGIHYTLSREATQNLPRGSSVSLDLTLTADRDQPIVFEPVMGAYAHMVAFAPGRNGFAHLHPLNPYLAKQDPTNPDLSFRFSPGTAGTYRLWAQVKIDGREHFVPFDIKI